MKTDVAPILLWLGALAGFVALGLDAGNRNAPGVDLDVARAIQDLPGSLGLLFDAVNWLGGGWPVSLLALCTAGVFLTRGLRLETALLALSFAARGTQALMKEVFAAPRPLPSQIELSQTLGSFSYPSGHVVGTTVLFVLLFVFAPRLGLGALFSRLLQAVCVTMVLAMPLARVWSGAHWPSDGLGGLLFAALWLIPILRYEAALRSRLNG